MKLIVAAIIIVSFLSSCAFSSTETLDGRSSAILPTEDGSFRAGHATFVSFSLHEASDPEIRFYISKTDVPRPILLLIQGSGCNTVFYTSDGKTYTSTVYSTIPFAQSGEFAVMVVEKPFSPRQPNWGGLSVGCPSQFNDTFSLESWTEALRRALAAAKRLPWVNSGNVRVLGFSEGATAAARLAAQESTISQVALVGLSGDSQLFDLIAASQEENRPDSEKLSAILETQRAAERVRERPNAADELFAGHPFKRWSSFFSADPSSDLLKSHARVYLVSGMKDGSVPSVSTELAYVRLSMASKDVQLHLVPDADHALIINKNDPSELEKRYKDILHWFNDE